MSSHCSEVGPLFEVRGASLENEAEIVDLAKHLNTVNLPNHAPSIRKLLKHVEGSFASAVEPDRRKFVFVLWDLTRNRAVGTSSLIARLGTRDAPYLYFDVIDEERYSRTLDKHFRHTLLRLGSSYAGPTELGGLVVAPEYRGNPQKLGRFISFSRFAFLAAHRQVFQSQLLAELMPPLKGDGRSHLWEALGRRLTGLTYAEADLLSSQDKEFVQDLFPRGLINTSLLSLEAKSVVGQVGQATLGVERMLRSIGFQYARRVDPFDGGPHFVADTDSVAMIAQSRRCVFARELTNESGSAAVGSEGLVLQNLPSPPYVRVVQSSFAWDTSGDGPPRVFLPKGLASLWKLAPQQSLHITPRLE